MGSWKINQFFNNLEDMVDLEGVGNDRIIKIMRTP